MGCAGICWQRQPFDRHALCWLAYPEDFGDLPAAAGPDFGPWTTGVGAAILEALQPVLSEQLVATESAKEEVRSPRSCATWAGPRNGC